MSGVNKQKLPHVLTVLVFVRRIPIIHGMRLIAVPFCCLLISGRAFAGVADLAKKPDDWFRGAEARAAIDNVLSHQSPLGDWPMHTDTSKSRYTSDPTEIAGTFDNRATTGELRVLARAFNMTRDDRCRDAVLRGIDHIFAAQYPTGGWPQSFPPFGGYHRHITFNDGAMQGLLELLREVAADPRFSFVDAPRREAAGRAFERGAVCIVKCQVRVNGELAVWCAQHDEETFEPRPARTFELISLSGAESAGLLRFLMSLESPGADVSRAIEAGVRWFDRAKLTGVRTEVVGGDLHVVPDPAAPPLWARFYEIETNRPFFCGRDGVKKYDIAEIEPERRNGYAWFGSGGKSVARDYAKWAAKRKPAAR